MTGMEGKEFGRLIRQQRVMIPLTLQELARMSGISQSYLGRIEGGERFPSANVLRKLAKPLGFAEEELFTLAGYLSPQVSLISEAQPSYGYGKLDPYVSRMLASEPLEMQRAVIGILAMLKSIARAEKELYKRPPAPTEA